MTTMAKYLSCVINMCCLAGDMMALWKKVDEKNPNNLLVVGNTIVADDHRHVLDVLIFPLLSRSYVQAPLWACT